jgi:hypothetical protein
MFSIINRQMHGEKENESYHYHHRHPRRHSSGRKKGKKTSVRQQWKMVSKKRNCTIIKKEKDVH